MQIPNFDLELERGAIVKKSIQEMNMAYNPNVGFIGHAEVKVSNYLFSAKKNRTAYQHAKPITERLLKHKVSNHYSESKRLTKFLKARDLTFSKKIPSGEYKTFTVPCTTTIVPIEKSLFNEVELSAQKLMISLRGVIQDIYGSKNLESSAFVNSLPKDVRKIFIQAIKSSSNYFPQLHHPNMKEYPFLDNVGLDLVLVEDYLQKSNDFPSLLKKNKFEDLPGLPFRVLEINAGSPSGASNNMNVLEGIYKQEPEILDNLGKLMPNDHFEILQKTYKSLGENWTGNKNGIQILLPPGGQNGAAPEIHQLAAYSGLIYADASQLYQDKKGHIRLRTVSKENPIVNAIYSRINADAALFDPKKGILLKDPDSAQPVYLRDDLILDSKGDGKIIKDENGNPTPQHSSYAIPGILKAIINKKIYLGGLNRILDNKIILATLTHYAPKYFADKILSAGLTISGPKILPPQTLPPTKKSVDIILKNPDEWVVKAPSLAGGQGVYILKTMPKIQKDEVLKLIQEKPTEFAYQQLVKIARIPVAVQRKAEGFKFANLAADIRTWVFYGGEENCLPQMSHNALVRYAPQEKGKMSSIVNTSAGGGYAPFVIIDDINSTQSVSAKELVKQKEPIAITIDVPIFAAAQMVQVARMLKKIYKMLSQDQTYAYELLRQTNNLKDQLKEILSFLHPRAIGHIYKVIELLEMRVSKIETKEHDTITRINQLKLVDLLQKHESHPRMKELRDILDNIRALNTEKISLSYKPEEKALDLVLVDDLISNAEKIENKEIQNAAIKVARLIKSTISHDMPNVVLGNKTKKTIRKHFSNFCSQSQERMLASKGLKNFAELFQPNPKINDLSFETLYLGKRDQDKIIKVGTQFEMRKNQSLTSNDLLPPDIVNARLEWRKVESIANTRSEEKRKDFLDLKRKEHFQQFPKLKKMQDLINKKEPSIDELIELLDVVPYAKFNIEKFATEQGISIKDIFSNRLTENKISLLSSKQLKKYKITHRGFAGECFAKKKEAHGLYSDSKIYIWIKKDLDPFTMLYTIGHELIHYHQIKNSMDAEKRALKGGGLSVAKFINYYGNFLGANERTVDQIDFDLSSTRKPLYGYADQLEDLGTDHIVMKELDQAIRVSDQKWEKAVTKYGSLFSYMMPTAPGTRVKAIQEVIPALENAKNILFAKSIGLDINIDPISAALPTANKFQTVYYAEDIIAACSSTQPIWESLRIIASHQYYGVCLNRADKDEDSLVIVPEISAIAVGSNYNQTQQ